MYDNLYHHGIKGQKWGVRRGPPYPIEDKILRKGTRLNSVSIYNNSDQYSKASRWMYTYNPEDKWDSKVYKGPFAVYKMKAAGALLYEHRYEVVKDLKMPTKKERIDEFISTFEKFKSDSIRDLQSIQTKLRKFDVGSKESQNVDLNNLKSSDDYKYAYEIFNHAMENVNNYKITKAYADIMSQKYDAMVDDNNQGVYNKVNDPIIIFRANEALKKIGKARVVSVKEVEKNFKTVSSKLVKSGEKVLL